jgi:predicted nucleotidyltransferase
MRFGLTEETIAKIIGVLAIHPAVEKAIIYGSRAMETHGNGSDIDLTLTGNVSFNDLLRINTQIDDLMLPYTVDISCFGTLCNAALIEHINRAGQTLYEKEK